MTWTKASALNEAHTWAIQKASRRSLIPTKMINWIHEMEVEDLFIEIPTKVKEYLNPPLRLGEGLRDPH
jgi:hypothetical protein